MWKTEKKLTSLEVKGVDLSIAISPDGKYLAAGIEEGNHSIVLDLAAKTQIASLGQVGKIRDIRFSSDGKLLVTGSSEASVYLWNAEAGAFTRAENTFNVNGEVTAMDFSPDNKWLAVGDLLLCLYFRSCTRAGSCPPASH